MTLRRSLLRNLQKAQTRSALLEVLKVLEVADVGDCVRRAADTICQAFELTEATGAALRERTDTRTNLRNGHRPPHASVAAL